MKRYRFETTCVTARGKDILRMRELAETVTYRTFLSHCFDVLPYARGLGYARAVHQGSGITLKRDWHVDYYRSLYQGRPCYYLVHSGIEHIWVLV